MRFAVPLLIVFGLFFMTIFCNIAKFILFQTVQDWSSLVGIFGFNMTTSMKFDHGHFLCVSLGKLKHCLV